MTFENVQKSLSLSCADMYIVLSSHACLGNIVESVNDTEFENIFDKYEMSVSEINFIKKMAHFESKSVFAIKTLTGEALVFVKPERSSYILSAIAVSIPTVKELIDSGVNINMSPTLTRYVRKCEHTPKSDFLAAFSDMLCLYDECFSDKEYADRGIIGYSSVYNCNIRVSEEYRDLYSGSEAIISREFLNILIQSVCIASAKYGKGNADLMFCQRGDIFSFDIFIGGCEGERVERLLEFLSNTADVFCTYFTYSFEVGGVRIKACPYFADEGLLGVKSRIIFEN